MKYPGYKQTLFIYRKIMQATGGIMGLRDEGLLCSALARPRMTFGGKDLYPALFEKVAVLGHSLIKNHPFVDGNKRLAFEVMDITLRMNGYRISTSLDKRYKFVLDIAKGKLDEREIVDWLRKNLKHMRAKRAKRD